MFRILFLFYFILIQFEMSKAKQMLLISSSRVYGYNLLEQDRSHIDELLKKNNVSTVLFVPYAGKDYDKYVEMISEPFNQWGYKIEGLHEKPNKVNAIKNAQAIFIGGGNTFVLLKKLYDENLIDVIREEVLQNGLPYIGSSAGTNVATKSIHTTNDMPVVYPPSFKALKLVPFNINPHYIDADPNSKHKGETRDDRLNEFMHYNNLPVLGLREGSSLMINDNNIKLVGLSNAKYFRCGQDPIDYPPGSDLSFLLAK